MYISVNIFPEKTSQSEKKMKKRKKRTSFNWNLSKKS